MKLIMSSKISGRITLLFVSFGQLKVEAMHFRLAVEADSDEELHYDCIEEAKIVSLLAEVEALRQADREDRKIGRHGRSEIIMDEEDGVDKAGVLGGHKDMVLLHVSEVNEHELKEK